MSCPALDIENGGLAEALRAVDCRTGEGTMIAFGRLFGAHGTLLPALTGLLTLYVALFAIGLLTGRVRLGGSSLTPRMLTMGLVLTFATSWLAYQNVIWTLATGAPDQLATLIAGTHGSATAAFADKLDMIFAAIADSTKQQTPAAAVSAAAAISPTGNPAGGVFTPQGMLWLSGLMLLVGTVGVLVTAKVALAALLALGPVFILLALFAGTRGLFEGWLKAVVSFAMVPMFTVLIGGAALTMITPLIRAAILDSSNVSTKAVTALFLGACVYSALMAIVVKTTTAIVSGWRLPFGATPETGAAAAPVASVAAPAAMAAAARPATAAVADTVRSIVAALPAPGGSDGAASISSTVRSITRDIATPVAANAAPSSDRRLQGVGSRFRAAPDAPSRARLK